jgi:arginase family enzyme
MDIDVLDPAFAPGVSHRESGGMDVRSVIGILHQLDQPVIGADLVEYNPEADFDGATAGVSAKLLKEILGVMIGGNAE